MSGLWCQGWVLRAFRRLSCEVQAVSACGAQVPQWSRVGRLKRAAFPSLAGGGHTFGGGAGAGLLAALAGRLLCDTYLGARELLREVDYTLATLARIHLGQTRSDLADVPGARADGA